MAEPLAHSALAIARASLPLGDASLVDYLYAEGACLLYSGRCESHLNQIHHAEELRIGQYRNLLFGANPR